VATQIVLKLTPKTGEDFHFEEIIFFEMGLVQPPTTLQGTNISLKDGILKMMFLFPRWDMLIPWRVVIYC